MEKFDIFRHIAERTGGDVYIGVVGPVRTGKSTFISRFMDLVVLPNMKDAYEKERTRDELPQSGAGKTIMTTEPKFVPGEAVEITLGENIKVAVRMVDCVGYSVPGALGYEEADAPRMVRTPWYEEEISFQRAAEIGTEKVIQEHSTIGLVVITDGSITEIQREAYIDAERRVVAELKELGKPFIVVLNSTHPEAESTRTLGEALACNYDVPVIPVDCLNMSTTDIMQVLGGVLYEFPVREISVKLPEWVMELEEYHPVRISFVSAVQEAVSAIDKVRDVSTAVQILGKAKNTESATVTLLDMGTGRVWMEVTAPKSLFYAVISEMSGLQVTGDSDVIRMMRDLTFAKREYDKVAVALEQVRATGYGIVTPFMEEIYFEEPDIIRQGNRCGVRLKAMAPSIHMIRADIRTEVTPLMGTEKQSEEFAEQIAEDFAENPSKIWETEFLGRSMQDLIREGIEAKLSHMPVHAQEKLQETLQKIVNEGSGGLICIVL
ncbi:MAG: stage IV sporulation protein A [Firmicutes bacterium]|nr:stage IV sporulation protein A [Bacillota bacterium]MDD4336853.1 stage IV sporulation protein A [Bacillota bacterium]